jgi:MFS family permease
VPPEHFYSAATWSSTIWQVSAIFGPALAGILIALTLNAAWVYLINVLAGLVLVAALLLMRSQQRDYASAAETPWQSIKAGWRFLRGSQVVFASIALDMFAVLLGGATFLLPVFAKDILQTDAAGLGLLRAAPSIGAVTMALIASRLPPFEKAGKTLLWAVAGFGIATIIFGLSTSFWLSLAMLALLGALDNISVIIRHTLVLTQTPDAMRGRVNAVNSIFIGASNELGGFESGYLASLLGPVGAVVIGGIGTLVVVLATACLAPKLREYGRLGSSTLQNQTP